MLEPHIPSSLQEVAQQVERGERPSVTVRTLISWFWGSQRRGQWIVTAIRAALDNLGLETRPDFNSTYLDGLVTFIAKPQQNAGTTQAAVTEFAVSLADTLTLADSASVESRTLLDPVYRIGRLTFANNRPVSVVPDTPVEKATTIMLRNDFSQLPVMEDKKTALGLFSWKSLGSHRAVGQMPALVKDAMEDYREINPDTTLFKAIDLIEENDCVLLRSETGEITSIITPYDISKTFGQLSEPFLVVRDIESQIRTFISEKFSDEEVALALKLKRAPRKSGLVHSLTFGEYVRFLEEKERWLKLNLQIDLVTFVEELEKVRDIRNDVMHFDPEGIGEDDLEMLRGFADFLRRIKKLKDSVPKAVQGAQK
jgi:CBS domain-containing protein